MPETQEIKAEEKAPEKTEQENSSTPNENGTETDKTPEQEPPKEMRAVVLTGFSGLKSVKLLKKAEPTLGEGEILIRVKACGLNFQDLMVRQGYLDSIPKTPFILGIECAGDVEVVGEGVEDFKVGDRVVALPEYRAWAELAAVPAKYAFKLPDNLTYQDAVAIAMNYIVAYILLFDLANLAPGKSVLVHSAGGGVGLAVAQLAKTVKDVTVYGVASKSKHEAIQSYIENLIERGTDYMQKVRKLSPDGVDIVLDCLCGEDCMKGYSLLKPMGKYILYGSANIITGENKSIFSTAKNWWQMEKISPWKLFDENKSVTGFNLRHLLYQHGGAAYIKNVMTAVFNMWRNGKIKPVIDSSWALEDVPEAMQKMHDRKNVGKIILDPSLEPKPKPSTPAKGKSKADKEDKKKEEEKKDEEKKDEEKKEENSVETNGTKENSS